DRVGIRWRLLSCATVFVMSRAVPLLVYTPDSVAPTAGFPDLETFVDALSARLPGTFFLPVSQRSPAATRPRADRDWVLLPNTMHLSRRGRLLQNTYRWFEANTALFLGAETEADFRLFSSSVGGAAGHKLWWDGTRWALDATHSLSGEPFTALVHFLASRLPVVCEADALSDEEWLSDCETPRAEAALRVLVRASRRPAHRRALIALAHRHPRRVSLRLRLHRGLTSMRGILELRELLRADPPLDLTIFAENPLF